jgi:hypothetical protein
MTSREALSYRFRDFVGGTLCEWSVPLRLEEEDPVKRKIE